MLSDYHTLLSKAWEQHRVAEHLLTVTFPLAKEPKILWGVVSSLISSLEFAQEMKPNPSSAPLLSELKELWELHQNSPVEFRRKEQLIVCTKEYYCESLTEKRVEEYLKETKRILESIASLTKSNRK